MFPNPALSHLLARWHSWRRGYTHERGLIQARAYGHEVDDDDERLEAMQMRALEAVIEAMAPEWQLALQHVARAEFLGAEIVLNPRLGDSLDRERLVVAALRELERQLKRADVL